MCLPNLGMETVHHVHADDVAQAFAQAVLKLEQCNWREFPRSIFSGFNPARLCSCYLKLVWSRTKLEIFTLGRVAGNRESGEAQATWDHIAHSPNCSIAKANDLLGYQPRYSSLQAVKESLRWLIGNNMMLS